MKKSELVGIAAFAYGGWELWLVIPSEIRELSCGVFCIAFPITVLSLMYMANETLRVSGRGLLNQQPGKKTDSRTNECGNRGGAAGDRE